MRLDEFPFCITAGVILSAAVFQAKSRILRVSSLPSVRAHTTTLRPFDTSTITKQQSTILCTLSNTQSTTSLPREKSITTTLHRQYSSTYASPATREHSPPPTD